MSAVSRPWRPGRGACRACALLALCLARLPLAAAPLPLNLYVSLTGNDAWSGRLAEPNPKKTDGPFRTLERARDAVRALKKAGKPPGGVIVSLRGGIYERGATFVLSAEDSGTPAAPLVYRAYGNETVRLLGGREVKGFRNVMNPTVMSRLDPAARGKVLQADLKTQGITDYGQLTPRGFGRPTRPAPLELFFEERPMQIARWPNDGYATIAAAPAGNPRGASPQGAPGGTFPYEGDRPGRWKNADDIWVHGFWTWDWAESFEKVKAINTRTREIETLPPHGVFGYKAGKRYYALNILEELDAPGEYYVDRKAGILYFWPPAPPKKGRAVVSLLEEPLVSLRNVSDVTLRGLILEDARGAGIRVAEGKDILIAGCTLRNLGTNGVEIGGGTGHGVAGCDLYNIGECGIVLSGGDRKTLTPGNHFAVNNHLHDFSRWVKTYRPGVQVNGVGNRIAHNLIHGAPHSGIILSGNEHVIEFNEIHHVCQETGDAGAFYMGRDYTQRGNILRHNYFHHLKGVQGQKGFTDVVAVYLDDATSGTTVFGNVFYQAGRAAVIGGGRDNTIENNLFVDCRPAVHVDARALSWAKDMAAPGGSWRLIEKLQAMNYKQPPYSTRYPTLATILEDEPAVPRGNRIVRNISFGGKWIELQDHLTDKILTIEDNLTEGDPGFVAPEKEDFRLRADSPAYKRGFQRIPIEKIGPYKDE